MIIFIIIATIVFLIFSVLFLRLSDKWSSVLDNVFFGRPILFFIGEETGFFVTSLHEFCDIKFVYRFNATKIGPIQIIDDNNAIYCGKKIKYCRVSKLRAIMAP